MERRHLLTKGSHLWLVDEPANTIATLERGRLVVHVEGRLLGIVTPGMVIGESSLRTLDGDSPTRSATVSSFEDATEVVEHEAAFVRAAHEEGDGRLIRSILVTMVGQIGRNLLLLGAALKERPAVAGPLGAMLQGVVRARSGIREADAWSEHMAVFAFLAETRAYTERLRSTLIPGALEVAALIEGASIAMQERFGAPEDRDIAPLLAGFLDAEVERDRMTSRREPRPVSDDGPISPV